jgi:hypothetical protein
MGAVKVGDRVRAYPANLGTPDQTNFDPRVEGIVVGMSNAGGQLTIMVEHGGIITSCEARTVTVIELRPAPEPDRRPDLVAAVYANGRTETRRRGSGEVIAEADSLGALALRLVSAFPDGFHLDIRFDPHM